MRLIVKENKFDLLLEERGSIPMTDSFISEYVKYIINTIYTPFLIDKVVGGSKYKIFELINTDNYYNDFRITLKDTLNNFIDNGSWFKDITIVLNIRDYKDKNQYQNSMNSKYNSGDLLLENADIDEDNRIIGAIITLNMCSYSSDMNILDLKSMLSHELGHMYSFYNKGLKGNVEPDKTFIDIDKLKSTDFGNGFISNLAYILYVLDSEEIRAEVASVYQGLKELNSTQETVKNDINKVDAYIKYLQSKKVLTKFKTMDDESLKIIYNKMSSVVNGSQDIYKWKKMILTYMENGINKLINGIGRSVSKYVDDIKQ